MSAYYEIPLVGQSQQLNISILGTEYVFTTRYYDIPDIGGWFLTIDDSSGNNIVDGMAMVAGSNLLAQYGAFDLLGANTYGTVLFLWSDGSDPFVPPTYSNLGTDCHLLYYVPDPPVVVPAGIVTVIQPPTNVLSIANGSFTTGNTGILTIGLGVLVSS